MAKSRAVRSKSKGKNSRKGARGAAEPGRTREVVGVIGMGTAVFVMAGLLSLQLGDGNLMGPLGRGVAKVFYGFLGLFSYGAVLGLGAISLRLLTDQHPLVRLRHFLGGALAAVCVTAIAHLFGAGYRVAGYPAGGLLGEHVGEVFRALISTAGTTLLALVGLVIATVIATPLRMSQVIGMIGRGWLMIATGGRFAGRGAVMAGSEAARFSGEVIRAVLPEREYDDYLDDYDDEDEDDDEVVAKAPKKTKKDAVVVEELSDDTERVDGSSLAAMMGVGEVSENEEEDSTSAATKAKSTKKAKAALAKDPDEEDDEDEEYDEDEDDEDYDEDGEEEDDEDYGEEEEEEAELPEPVIVERQFKHPKVEEMAEKEKEVDADRLEFIPLGDGEYKLPPASLLNYDDSAGDSVDRDAMLELSARLTKTLEHYGVKGEVKEIRPGPVVTMYEFAPAPGTRVSKISNLGDDLAMALEALRVRIVAPIPGKAAVGIEVPNKTRETVYFKEIIADKCFQESKHKLPLAIGKDIEGRPSLVDLARMPHLLVAGTTGSGKSVAVNSMITSLLYNSSPEEVRMIMVDPKMLELSIYEGIPHLLLPVVTDPKKANLALRWAVEEMERRYELLAGMGVRDITNYNKKLAKVQKQYEADRLQRIADEAARLADEEADEELDITEERDEPIVLEDVAPPKKLPFIVVIIDEFADLMMVASKEVETSVARIAQKARAAGIHLILATQRPSVDVITGLIKANFPSRAAFHVTSKTDSRTILDQGGAEALLGSGDMLFSDRGASPTRFHGCFIDEDEIHRVVDFLKTQGKPVYNLDILKPRDEDSSGAGGEDKEPADEMYDRAVGLVAETQQVSISMIQRRLRIGYNRAARIVEMMEREGVVGGPDGTNKREVLIAPAA